MQNGKNTLRNDEEQETTSLMQRGLSINSEAVIKSVSRGFLKVTPRCCEKGMKFLFVLITIIRYFKLSSKQMSILRKVLSSSSQLIVKLD